MATTTAARKRPPDAGRPAPPIGQVALVLGALGVVFGDIGTSPLYALQVVFSPDADRPVPVNAGDILGVVSLVFWLLVVIVTLKYVVLVMRADNDGEGGIMALIGLLRRLRPREPSARRTLAALIALGILGAALFVGDVMITPAISVLSAVEGLKVIDPALADAVVPVAAVILVALFAFQRKGTSVVGRAFGPVMLVWFAALAALGVEGIAMHPGVLRALSPTYAVTFFSEHGLTAFLALGGVVLAVTGVEALYADMGHFGRGPIRRAWLLLVFPALLLNYLGQGAYLVEDPSGIGNPFYALVPGWAQVPTVLLATAATVIASQAVISGAFSITRQAIQLGYLPRLRVIHPNHHEGQIYLPFINWALLAAVLALVATFRHSSDLAFAYGIAVAGTIAITTVLFFVVARQRARMPLALAVAGAAAFLTVEFALLGANAVKILHGGWLPLAVAALVFLVLATWRKGHGIVTRNREALEGRLRDFVRDVRVMDPPLHRIPGTSSSTAATRPRRWPCAPWSTTHTPCMTTWSFSRSRPSPFPTSTMPTASSSTTSTTTTTASPTSRPASGSWKHRTCHTSCSSPAAMGSTVPVTSPTSFPRSPSPLAAETASPAGANGCSAASPDSPLTPSSTSSSRASARSSSARTSRSERDDNTRTFVRTYGCCVSLARMSSDPGTCDLLCLDLPMAETVRASMPTNDELESWTRAAKALGDATRLALAIALRDAGRACVCDLAWIIGRDEKLVPHHVRQLRSAGLAPSERDGKMVMYELNDRGREVLAAVTAEAHA